MRLFFGTPPLLLALVAAASGFAPPSGPRGASSGQQSCHALLRRASPAGALPAKPTPPGPREGEREEDLPEDMGEKKMAEAGVFTLTKCAAAVSCSWGILVPQREFKPSPKALIHPQEVVFIDCISRRPPREVCGL